MNKLVEIIGDEIAASGIMPFARFMELALYCPQLGYYEQNRDTVGRAGDFYTSVSVGPLFGELLAFQFADWLAAAGGDLMAEIRIVEAGAHDGKLARDILDWFRAQRPELFARLRYDIIEPSAIRRGWQAETLRLHASQVYWLADLREFKQLPAAPAVIFGNELLDAMPVHRLGWDARRREWFGWGVGCVAGRFEWARMKPAPPPSNFHLPGELVGLLPDGYTVETSPAAEAWWQAAAGCLTQGKLIALDYGGTADELFRPEKPHGTLRAYQSHQVRTDLLADPGAQDLTAHVNFTAIQRAGESVGLHTLGLFTQSQFLTRIAGAAWKDTAAFGGWTPARTRQFQTLTHPEHLGRAFRVLVQER